jgi:choice-of-anchor A domain-containing protein
VDPALGLGAATGESVLELGPSSVQITGPAGGLIGNVAIAPHGQLQMSGSEYITGTISLGAGATFQNSSSGSIGPVLQNVDLSAQIAAAYAAANAASNMPCTQVFNGLDGKNVTQITGVAGVNVICVHGDIVLNGTQIALTGPSTAKFIFNITGKLVMNGGGNGPGIRVDPSSGILPSAVLYNVLGAGQDVAMTGGGGGINCCVAILDGTLLAPGRKIALSPGLVNGEVISAQNISIVSGSSVRCPCQ